MLSENQTRVAPAIPVIWRTLSRNASSACWLTRRCVIQKLTAEVAKRVKAIAPRIFPLSFIFLSIESPTHFGLLEPCSFPQCRIPKPDSGLVRLRPITKPKQALSARAGSMPRRLRQGSNVRLRRVPPVDFELAHQVPQLVRHFRQMLGRGLRFADVGRSVLRRFRYPLNVVRNGRRSRRSFRHISRHFVGGRTLLLNRRRYLRRDLADLVDHSLDPSDRLDRPARV